MEGIFMNRISSRIISAGILAIIMGCSMHVYYVHGGQMGRDAFLAKEAARYDRFFAQPGSIVIDVIVSLFLLGVLFVAYELIAFVVLKILERINAAPV
jgi:hypothetical protein